MMKKLQQHWNVSAGTTHVIWAVVLINVIMLLTDAASFFFFFLIKEMPSYLIRAM